MVKAKLIKNHKKIIKTIGISILFLILIITGGLSLLYTFNDTTKELVSVMLMNMDETTKFDVLGNKVYMSGTINSKTYDQFVKLTKENPQVNTIVEINIDGSVDDDTMIKLSYHIREKGFNTKLLSFSNINSGGVDLFLAGVNRTMERGAHIGVHSWSDGFKEAKEFPKKAEEHEQNRKYIEVMLGEDDFYWFTIYAAPANGIHEMSEEEINKYKILTSPIITENLTEKNIITAVISNNFGNFVLGNLSSDTIIINSQGGPILNFNPKEIFDFLIFSGELNLNKTALINIHQEQTLEPWKFQDKIISYEDAIEYDKKSVKRLSDTIKYFKSTGKKVYVIGTSFGAFVVQDSIVEHGNLADKYLIIVGRLNMQKEVWEEFSKGTYVGFVYDENGDYDVIKFSAQQAGMGGSGSISDKNMAKLAAGLGHKRYITLLNNTNLSNVRYAYGKKDEQVGSLTKQEVSFLESKGVKIFQGENGHGETNTEFIKQGLNYLFE